MNTTNPPAARMPDDLRAIVEAQENPIEIRIGNVDFTTKIDALAAAVQSVRLAHRDEISARSWAALNEVERQLSEAVFHRNDRRVIDAARPGAPLLGDSTISGKKSSAA